MMGGRSAAVPLALLFLAGALGCPKKPAEPTPKKGVAVAQPKTYEVSKRGRLVLTVTDAPGPILSTAILPAGEKPAVHPFLSASAHAPEEENALRALLDQAASTQGFLELLRKAGYQVAEQAPQ